MLARTEAAVGQLRLDGRREPVDRAWSDLWPERYGGQVQSRGLRAPPRRAGRQSRHRPPSDRTLSQGLGELTRCGPAARETSEDRETGPVDHRLAMSLPVPVDSAEELLPQDPVGREAEWSGRKGRSGERRQPVNVPRRCAVEHRMEIIAEEVGTGAGEVRRERLVLLGRQFRDVDGHGCLSLQVAGRPHHFGDHG